MGVLKKIVDIVNNNTVEVRTDNSDDCLQAASRLINAYFEEMMK